MPKFFCDYCDVYLTHDSMSVRKAHNSGRNHLRNVVEYYQQIGQERAQNVIDDITNSYAESGQAANNPLLGHSAAQYGPPVGFPPMGRGGPWGGPGGPDGGMPPMPFPPLGRGMPLRPPQGMPPGFIAPPQGMPPGYSSGGPPAGSSLNGMPFGPPGQAPRQTGGASFPPPRQNGPPGGMNGGPPGGQRGPP